MPFQCAHGRPLLAPLANVAKLAHIGKQVRYINFVCIVFLSRHNLDVTYNLKNYMSYFFLYIFFVCFAETTQTNIRRNENSAALTFDRIYFVLLYNELK